MPLIISSGDTKWDRWTKNWNFILANSLGVNILSLQEKKHAHLCCRCHANMLQLQYLELKTFYNTKKNLRQGPWALGVCPHLVGIKLSYSMSGNPRMVLLSVPADHWSAHKCPSATRQKLKYKKLFTKYQKNYAIYFVKHTKIV